MKLDSKIPAGPLADKWNNHKAKLRLVNPANRRKYHIIVVGSGLAGSAAAASFAEMGYEVSCFCYQDSPRRAHSIAAQGGINAAKNYQNDGDSVHRLFYDTLKGGDYRAREANVHRLAEVSVNIIDQCVAQGVPFAREYGGLLANRSFGGAQVSRTFYARGQTGQQLLLGAYSALMKETANGNVEMYTRREMLDLIVVDGRAVGIVVRNLISGKLETYTADAVLLALRSHGDPSTPLGPAWLTTAAMDVTALGSVTVLSLGLFLFVINALMFWSAAGVLSGFNVTGFGAALIGSVIYSLCGMVIDVAMERMFKARA